MSKHRRKPDLVWEAMLEVCGLTMADVDAMNTLERKRLNAARKLFTECNASPGQIRARAAEYRRRWPKVTFSLFGLAANWTQFQAAQTPRDRVVERCRAFFLRHRAVLGGIRHDDVPRIHLYVSKQTGDWDDWAEVDRAWARYRLDELAPITPLPGDDCLPELIRPEVRGCVMKLLEQVS